MFSGVCSHLNVQYVHLDLATISLKEKVILGNRLVPLLPRVLEINTTLMSIMVTSSFELRSQVKD